MISREPASPRPSSPQRAPHVVDALLAHPAQHAGSAARSCARSRPRSARMICARPRNCSGVRSPRVTLTSTVTKPSCFCSAHVGGAEALELGEVAVGAAVALRRRGRRLALVVARTGGARSRSRVRRPSRPCSSSSTWLRSSSMPYLSTNTLMRARARLTRSHSWRSKMRKTASAIFRYSPLSSSTKSYSAGATRGMIEVPPPTSISDAAYLAAALDLAARGRGRRCRGCR